MNRELSAKGSLKVVCEKLSQSGIFPLLRLETRFTAKVKVELYRYTSEPKTPVSLSIRPVTTLASRPSGFSSWLISWRFPVAVSSEARLSPP